MITGAADLINRLIKILVISVGLFGCNTLPERRIFNFSNPTEFVFHSNEESLRNSIISKFDNLEFRGMSLYYKGSRFGPFDSLEFFDQVGTERDFYLSRLAPSIGVSYLYPPLLYHASFRLHVVVIDGWHTKLTVYTIKPKVLTGKDLLPSLPHFVRPYKYHKVERSTIEEYEILLRIGNGLGEQGMPALKKP